MAYGLGSTDWSFHAERDAITPMVERSPEFEGVVRRPSLLAVLVLTGLVTAATGALLTRDRPATPADREGRSAPVTESVPTISDLGIELSADRAATGRVGAVLVAVDGRLLVVGLGDESTAERSDDLPLTKPLLSVDGGVIGVSRGSAVFISDDTSVPVISLGVATEVFIGSGSDVWLSHNEAGPAYVDKLDGPLPGGERFPLGSGVIVHGLAESGLLLGRSGVTQVVPPGTTAAVTELPVFAEVLSVRGDVVVGVDTRCDVERCNLIIVDASDGSGGEWDMGEFRMPNQPSAELSPDGSQLAMFVVDRLRDLSVGVLDIASGDFRRGAVIGSSRSSGDVSWSADGNAVFYVDPVTIGAVREFRPFDDLATDVVIASDLGRVTSVAGLSVSAPR